EHPGADPQKLLPRRRRSAVGGESGELEHRGLRAEPGDGRLVVAVRGSRRREGVLGGPAEAHRRLLSREERSERELGQGLDAEFAGGCAEGAVPKGLCRRGCAEGAVPKGRTPVDIPRTPCEPQLSSSPPIARETAS